MYPSIYSHSWSFYMRIRLQALFLITIYIAYNEVHVYIKFTFFSLCQHALAFN